MSLRDIIHGARGGSIHSDEDRLLIKGDAKDLGLDDDCALARVAGDSAEGIDDGDLPAEFRKRGLRPTISYQELKESVESADMLAGEPDDAVALEMIRYMIRYGVIPDEAGARSQQEIEDSADLDFYKTLEAEVPGTRCRKEDCPRGTVKFSVFCRVHHFENLKGRPCPFAD